MTFALGSVSLETVGVVGAGTMGAHVARFFAEALLPFGVSVTVVERDPAQLDRARTRLEASIREAAEKKGKPEAADAVWNQMRWSTSLSDLSAAGWVVECATEDLSIKREIAQSLVSIVGPTTLLSSSSAHFTPDEIYAGLDSANRTGHFFYPADRNLLAEVGAGRETDGEWLQWICTAVEILGKHPIRTVRCRRGHAVNPVAAGVFAEATQIATEGLATPVEVDAIARRVLRAKKGPFAWASESRRSVVVAAGLELFHESIHPWFRVPDKLRAAIEGSTPETSNDLWELAAGGENVGGASGTAAVEPSEAQLSTVGDRLLGAYLGLSGEIVDAGLASFADINFGVGLALEATPPFDLINKLGPRTALDKIEAWQAASATPLETPSMIRDHALTEQPFEIPVVLTDLHDDVAVVNIRRPEALNALSPEVFSQLETVFASLRDNRHVRAVVLTGAGNRAFVAGADIKVLAKLLDAPDPKAAAVALCREMQRPLRLMETLGKPVVAALNGLALGGGSELALACTTRIGLAGQKVFVGQPEPNLGLIPGAGGTQRLPRLVGLEAAWPILRTAKPISSEKALEIGYVERLVGPTELREAAVELARRLARHEVQPARRIAFDGIDTSVSLPETELGHLSQAVDRLLHDAVVEGNQRSLDQGLEVEFEKFGDCFLTQDGRIGLENFLTNGPRSQAAFVHA